MKSSSKLERGRRGLARLGVRGRPTCQARPVTGVWHSLPVIITKAQLKDALGAELLQPLVHILAHGIEVLVGLVPKTKYLWTTGEALRMGLHAIWWDLMSLG